MADVLPLGYEPPAWWVSFTKPLSNLPFSTSPLPRVWRQHSQPTLAVPTERIAWGTLTVNTCSCGGGGWCSAGQNTVSKIHRVSVSMLDRIKHLDTLCITRSNVYKEVMDKILWNSIWVLCFTLHCFVVGYMYVHASQYPATSASQSSCECSCTCDVLTCTC